MLSGNEYEDRLIERIAAREAIAAVLTPRQRHIFSRYHYHDETYKEIAARDGVSHERIRQLHLKGLNQIHTHLRERPEPAPPKQSADLRATPPDGWFEEFRQHMVDLKERKAREAQEAIERAALEVEARRAKAKRDKIERERRALDWLLVHEEQLQKAAAPQQPQSKPQPPPPKPIHQPPKPPLVWQPLFPAHPQPTVQAVEPWFDPAILPTHEHLKFVALYALNYFCVARGLEGWGKALQRIGETVVQVVCARDADAIAGGMMRLHRDLPAAARLSAIPLAVPDGMLGVVMANPHAALRLISYDAGTRVSIELTWDLGG